MFVELWDRRKEKGRPGEQASKTHMMHSSYTSDRRLDPYFVMRRKRQSRCHYGSKFQIGENGSEEIHSTDQTEIALHLVMGSLVGNEPGQGLTFSTSTLLYILERLVVVPTMY